MLAGQVRGQAVGLEEDFLFSFHAFWFMRSEFVDASDVYVYVPSTCHYLVMQDDCNPTTGTESLKALYAFVVICQ